MRAGKEPTVRSLNFGHLSEFGINEGDWFLNQELLEQYFSVKVVEKRRVICNEPIGA